MRPNSWNINITYEYKDNVDKNVKNALIYLQNKQSIKNAYGTFWKKDNDEFRQSININ